MTYEFIGTPLERIGFVGEIAAGKDTAALEFQGTHWQRPLAAPIKSTIYRMRTYGVKDAANYLFNKIDKRPGWRTIITAALMLASDIPKENKKDRAAVQFLGEELRKLDPMIWINLLLQNLPKGECVRVPDVRKLSEAKALIENGFSLIYVTAPELTRLERAVHRDHITPSEFYRASQHPAEQEIRSLKPLCRWVINNPDKCLLFDGRYMHEQIKKIKSEVLKNYAY